MSLALISFLIISCSKITNRTQTSILRSFISEHDAVGSAIKIASTSNFHFTGASETPTNIQANLMTLGEAVQRLGQENYSVAYDNTQFSSDLMVWVVTMDGIWPNNFPPVKRLEPIHIPWRHLAVILTAETGDLITLAVP
jgi:hypothetical protein